MTLSLKVKRLQEIGCIVKKVDTLDLTFYRVGLGGVWYDFSKGVMQELALSQVVEKMVKDLQAEATKKGVVASKVPWYLEGVK